MTRRSIDTADTDLVEVAYAHDEVGAEFLQGLLADVDIPSVVRRAPAFDVPGMGAAGRRDVLVSTRDADAAREVLRMEEPAAAEPTAIRSAPWAQAWVLIALALVAAVVCVAADVLA
jgi:Putative prokaryotic signal transducing protein